MKNPMYDSIVRALDCIVTHRYSINILYWYIFINISGNETDWITILTYSFVEVWVNSITQYFKTQTISWACTVSGSVLDTAVETHSFLLFILSLFTNLFSNLQVADFFAGQIRKCSVDYYLYIFSCCDSSIGSHFKVSQNLRTFSLIISKEYYAGTQTHFSCISFKCNG